MCKRLLLITAALTCTLAASAQENTSQQERQEKRNLETYENLVKSREGGIKGSVVNRTGRTAIPNASLTLSLDGEVIATGMSSVDGAFNFENLENGIYRLSVSASGFMPAEVNVTVEGFVKDLMFVTMVSSEVANDLDDSNFVEFDMDDSGYDDTPTLLYGNDVYTNIVGYGFSPIRFKNRGYTSESQDVYLSGIKMNDAITGYTPFSLWSGLNEAMRSKENTVGIEASDYGVGGYNGVTNILATPSSVRPGWRFSVLTNSALYRLRLMGTYASGELDNGWSYAFNVSARIGGNDWVKGVYYRSFAYYAGVEKKFGDVHRLSLVAFGTPGNRGAQNASTQEVYDLMGDNMYNSNWGYQNGKVRNSRVRKTHEPVFILKYTANPLENLEASATILYRTGKNGYTALDWYDASDPRPDYYRNLPSYFWVDNDDIGRHNPEKYEWAMEAWKGNNPDIQHLNWDRLYNVNWNNRDAEGRLRSKYALEERRVDQNDVNIAANVKWRAKDWFTLTGGLSFKWNRTEYYKKMNDLLGGEYYVNIDQFAERDFTSRDMIQNDYDYFLKHGEAQKITKGMKYGYDYYANVRNADIWLNGTFERGGFRGNIALAGGYSSFWREGLMRKGLFPGLDENGNPYYDSSDETKMLTTFDENGNAITSKGRSEKAKFFTYSAKIGASYMFKGGHRIYANVGYFNDAPTFNQAFISPRTRNTLVKDLTTTKTFSADLNYVFSNNGFDVRLTGFYTKIMDQTDMMSFYDDSQNSFTNFAMTGIDQRHMGLELGFRLPLGLRGLSLQGAVSYGEYIYTSIPRMTQTIDNSAEVIVKNQPVPYWKSHPIYKKVNVEGTMTYDQDVNGAYILEKEQKHYVPSTPQLATSLGLHYRTNSYWFFELEGQFFANSYLDMNPLYRTMMAVGGPDYVADPAYLQEHTNNWYLNSTMADHMGITPEEIEYMASQERFKPVFLLNLSVGKSWYIQRKYNLGFSLQVNNITNNRGVKTGGYEQTRLMDSKSFNRYYRFDSKYFYMQGINYMLNLYFRF